MRPLTTSASAEWMAPAAHLLVALRSLAGDDKDFLRIGVTDGQLDGRGKRSQIGGPPLPDHVGTDRLKELQVCASAAPTRLVIRIEHRPLSGIQRSDELKPSTPPPWPTIGPASLRARSHPNPWWPPPSRSAWGDNASSARPAGNSPRQPATK